MSELADTPHSVTYVLGWFSVILATGAIAGTIIRILRRSGPYFKEFAVVGMATGAFLGGWRFAHPDLVQQAEAIANVGAGIFCLSALALAVFSRRSSATTSLVE